MKTRKRPQLLVLTALAVVVLACSQDTTMRLYVNDSGDSTFSSLRRREHVQIVWDGGTEHEIEATKLDTDLTAQCVDMSRNDPEYSALCNYTGPCQSAHCNVYMHLCAGNLLLELAGIVAEPRQMVGYSVPPQSLATRTKLQELAIVRGRLAVSEAVTQLRLVGGMASGSGCTATEIDDLWGPAENQQTYARSFAMAVVEGYELAKEASALAVRGNVDLADAYFSEHPTDRAATEFAISAPLQSRGHAAHLLVGGDEGLAELTGTTWTASTGAAFCTEPMLSASEKAALALLREAAVSPARLAADPTGLMAMTTDLILSETAGSDGVIPRLGMLWGQDFSTTSVTEFLDQVGLDRSDVVVARRYLVEEHDAFARSGSQLLPARMLAGGTATSFPLFAATARPPVPAPDAHYSTLARFKGTPPTDPWYPDATYADRGLAQLIDFTHTQAADLLANGTFSTVNLPPFGGHQKARDNA